MPASSKIIELVDRFTDFYDTYKSSSYNEAQVRREFIDPFFKELGWDIDNTEGRAERYKDVIHEDSIKMNDGKNKAPDYSFRIGGIRKFFVEAKKPAINLKENPEPAYQLRRYAWNAKLPISILTDFEEFIVYDCTKKPLRTDKASVGRIEYYTYKEYIEKWDEIQSKYSINSVLKGRFDNLADSLVCRRGGRGTAGIDDSFLLEIEEWRDLLAKNIALRNNELSVQALNTSVQTIIDRIVFLRICEDRGIEEYGQLRKNAEGKNIYENLTKLFIYADKKYNSGLFHFEKEEGMEEPDILTPYLKIDDKILKQIINHLYYPDSPYEFSVFPADILGQVYEQFLGKVIRLTDSHKAKIEEKPEVKKAGGVYYTPTYIVDYIVKNTVGRLLEGKTPKEVSELKILDLSSGSGSFLLGAYQYLLDWHIDWYMKALLPLRKAGKPETDKEIQKLLPVALIKKTKQKKKTRYAGPDSNFPIYQISETDWRLTSEEKKRILLNNIFGVDIDQQAVEVTKLSLLLKVLEGEKGERIKKQLTLSQRVLPSLHDNIKCGNSLIGQDIYSDFPSIINDLETFRRINAFNWELEFPDVFEKGGFDVVIGNPPYVRQELLTGQKEYFKSKYEVFYGTADLYAYFIEKGFTLLKEDGKFSYIVSNKWMRTNYGKPLRTWLSKKTIEEIIDFGDLPVFKKATTYPCIFRISKENSQKPFKAVQVDTLTFTNLSDYVKGNGHFINPESLDDKEWSLADKDKTLLLDKLIKSGTPLGEYVEEKIYRGIVTGFNKAFIIDEATKNNLISKDKNSAEIIKPFLAGKLIKRYRQPLHNKYLIFTRRGIEIDKYPAILAYLQQFKNELTPKPKGWEGEWNGRKPGLYKWYEIQDSIEYYKEFEKDKIIYPNICKAPEFTYDDNSYYTNQKCFIIPTSDKYLLGILNSRLNLFLFNMLLPKLRGGFFEPSYIIFKNFPIYVTNFSKPEDVNKHDKIVYLVDQMLEMNKKLSNSKLSNEKQMIQRRIEAVDAEINRLVYQLYDLTEEEIKIVETK